MHEHPLAADKQVLVVVCVPHMPQVSLQVPYVHDDHVPPVGQVTAGFVVVVVAHPVDAREVAGAAG